MSMSVCFKSRRAGGFTLVELMVTLVVAAILVSIAVPSYQAQVRKSRRTEARNAVMDLATREERYYSVNNTYTNVALELGYGQDNAVITDRPVGSGYYTVSVILTASQPAATPPTPAGFQITATAAGVQQKDTQCQSFTVDDLGTQTSLPATDCWN
jgi:type IV pilus assembly protein PilE